MANPGPYGAPPNMGGPPMQQMGPPMGAQTMPRPGVVRRGTSKAVPVVVSAGLAVGVFCGLLFGLGTGKEEEASAATPSKGSVKEKDTPDTPIPSKDTPNKKPDTKVADSKTPDSKDPKTVDSKGSGDSKVADNKDTKGSGDKGSAAPAAHIAKLTLDIKPDPGPQAKITVDGKDFDPKKPYEIDLGTDKTKTVKLAISAPGFHSYEQKVDVNNDTIVTVELAKRGGGGVVTSGGNTAAKTPPDGGHTPIITNSGGQKTDGKKTGKKGSGVIDID